MELNLIVPKGWDDLTQDQLVYLLKAISVVNRSCAGKSYRSREDFATQVTAQVAIRCIFHWNNIKIVTPYADNWLIHKDGNEYIVTTTDLAAAAKMVDWMGKLPKVPVRLDIIDGSSAISADIEDDLSFDNYLACDALWQVWQFSQQDSLLRDMAAILYRKDDIKCKDFELISIFYWWAGLKSMLSKRYPNFLQPSSVDADAPHIDELTLRRSMDSQIRALTKGDITKEQEILSAPAIRALTELDALAREYDELNRKYPLK
ncbi:MAG: hypothetical protein ACI4AK_09370 [Lepagella sp.]